MEYYITAKINDQPTNIHMTVVKNHNGNLMKSKLQNDIYYSMFLWIYIIENMENEAILCMIIFIHNNIYQDSGYLWWGKEGERKIDSGEDYNASTVSVLFYVLKKKSLASMGKRSGLTEIDDRYMGIC